MKCVSNSLRLNKRELSAQRLSGSKVCGALLNLQESVQVNDSALIEETKRERGEAEAVF